MYLFGMREFFHNTGNVWMKYLNYGVETNYENMSSGFLDYEKIFVLLLEDLENSYDFPNEDFCLFVDFPFESLVVPFLVNQRTIDELSCLFQFLHQHFHFFNIEKVSFDRSIRSPTITADLSVYKCEIDCNFKKLIDQCRNKSVENKASKTFIFFRDPLDFLL